MNEPYLIVTPEQYQEGYLENRGGMIRHKNFVPLKKLEDGTWLVQAPAEDSQPSNHDEVQRAVTEE